MGKRQIHIDQLYREKEENLSSLPDDAWLAMEKRMMNVPKGGGIRWWRIGLVTSVAVVAVVLTFLFSGNNFKQSNEINPAVATGSISKSADKNMNAASAGINPDAAKGPGIQQKNTDEPANNAAQYEDTKQHNDNATEAVQAKQVRIVAEKSEANKVGDAIKKNGHNLAKANIHNDGASGLVQADKKDQPNAPKPSEINADETNRPLPTGNKNEIASTETAYNSSKNDSVKRLPDGNKGIDIASRKADPAKLSQQINQRLSLGFMAGYENNYKFSFDKIVIASRLQYKLSDRFSLAVMPSLKYGNATVSLPGQQSYISFSGTTIDSQVVTKAEKQFWQLTYKQHYDSIIVSHTASKTSWEVEFPLLLKYRVAGSLFVQGGPTFAIGRLISIAEQRQSVQQYEEANFTIEKKGVHSAPDTTKSFHHTVQPFTSHTVYESSAIDPLRVGYLVGFNYQYMHWWVDLLLQQNVGGVGAISNPDIKSLYALPYTRFLLGYTLGK